jgi:hypothetical protein
VVPLVDTVNRRWLAGSGADVVPADIRARIADYPAPMVDLCERSRARVGGVSFVVFTPKPH